MLNCLRISILFILPALSIGQSKVDSILNLAINASDTVKILHLVQAGQLMRYNDPLKADSVNLLALDLSRQFKFVRGIDFSLSNLSSVSIIKGNYDEALEYIDELLQLAKDEHIQSARIKGLNRLATVQYHTGENQKAIETNLEVLRLSEESGTIRNQINANNNVGINFERLGEYQKALEYYQLALDLAKELKLEYHQAAISANIGVIYKNEGQYIKAKEYFQNSIQVAERINNQNLLIDELSNLAEVYILEKDFINADATNIKAMSSARSMSDQNGLLKGYSLNGKIKYYRGEYKNAIVSLNNALELSKRIGDEEELITIYDFLNKSFLAIKEMDEAYKFLALYSAQKDSIFNIDKTNELNRIETLYQVAQKDKELVKQELEIEKTTQQRNLFIGGMAFIGLLGLITFYFLRRIMKGNKLLAVQKHELQQQKINNLERTNKILALDAMVIGQEEERRRIAEDLHDSLGSLMATVKGHFNAIQYEMDKISDLNIYKKTDKLINIACDEVRRISHNMMPKALVENGLIEAINDLVQDINHTEKIRINFFDKGIDQRLEEKNEIMIFRIVQELLQNVLKHADATEVLVQIIRQDQSIHLTVEDNGNGFDTSDNLTGLGLSSIRSRVDYLSGEIHIDTVRSEGTTIAINFPEQKA